MCHSGVEKYNIVMTGTSMTEILKKNYYTYNLSDTLKDNDRVHKKVQDSATI